MVLLSQPYGSRVQVALEHVGSPIPSLVATSNPSELAASPIGRCFMGPTFALWCLTPELGGQTIWGTVDERSLRDMMAIGKILVGHPAVSRRRRVLTDCRDIERVDADVLLAFIGGAHEQLADWSSGLERQAMIVPEGPGGILLSGALPMANIEHVLRVTHDVDSALAFVDHPHAAAAHATVSLLVEAARGSSALLSRLRSHLAGCLDAATIENSAAVLGMSKRTLQRELHRLSTSFSEQLREVRIATAEALLVHTDLKIEAIATQVGFGTASRMSASLRRDRNVTASELRAGHRR